MIRFFTFVLAVLLSVGLWAQAPQGFSYQAVIRGTNNSLVANKPVGLKISLLQGSENGTAIYVETHKPTSNENGLVTIAIGTGTKDASSNAFTTIDWSKGPYFIKTETDPSGGSSYSLTSVSQLLSVPYALYAGNGIKRISENNDTIFLSNGNYYINKSSVNTGNNSIPSGGGDGQVLTMCDGELKWTNGGGCPAKIASLDCSQLTIQGLLNSAVSSKDASIYIPYSGGNAGVFNSEFFTSTGVLGLQANLEAGFLEKDKGSIYLTITGTPQAPGDAKFMINFLGKSCLVNFPVLPSGYTSNIVDIDGNSYKTVYIGKQRWMAENLKVSRYNDGTLIPNVKDSVQWSKLTTGAWSNYMNDKDNDVKYGKLYNRFVLNKNVCPTGWHVPSDLDWKDLADYLGGASVAGGKMKEVGTLNWKDPNKDATNNSLFTALPGGFSNGSFDGLGLFGVWWSIPTNEYKIVYLTNEDAKFVTESVGNLQEQGLNFGFSIRCLKD